jgi:hypothetical protein
MFYRYMLSLHKYKSYIKVKYTCTLGNISKTPKNSETTWRSNLTDICFIFPQKTLPTLSFHRSVLQT